MLMTIDNGGYQKNESQEDSGRYRSGVRIITMRISRLHALISSSADQLAQMK